MRLDDLHDRALNWFGERQGAVIPPPGKLAGTDLFLAQTAKAIHVPAGWRYALSVKIVPGSRYPDGDVVQDDSGRWSVSYHREEEIRVEGPSPDPEGISRNIALRNCQADGIPVAVMRRVRPKPGVLYEVIGLGRVTGYSAPYFRIEGPYDRRTAAEGADLDFSNEPNRELAIASVRRRLGQPAFRAALFNAYDGQCAATGCDVSQVLEAAHIVAYSESNSHDPRNGLLLRADIHTLFDLNLVRINPESRVLEVASALLPTEYGRLHGLKLREPRASESRPSTAALRKRYSAQV